MKRWTVESIKASVERPNGPSRYFFSPSWMRVACETLDCYQVKHTGERVFLVRIKGKAGPATWEFFPETGELVLVDTKEV